MDKCLFDMEARKTLRLVHGNPILTVPPHIKHGHAWIEIGDDIVYDAEGKHEVPKELYYMVGQIDPKECFFYTYEEMAKKIDESDHWGPWEFEESQEETEYREAHCG
jgi:hypothetical protein